MTSSHNTLHPNYGYEIRNWSFNKTIAGVDEAGRGPLAGPVVAAAVILDPNNFIEIPHDSKKLTRKQREFFYSEIRLRALSIGLGIVDNITIDEINILEASLLAMARAVSELSITPDLVLIDGNKKIPLEVNQETIVKGDTISSSIAAASVIAKVQRDRIMEKYDEEYPVYNFKQHKGYPTQEHIQMLEKHGSSPIHRKSFKWVK